MTPEGCPSRQLGFPPSIPRLSVSAQCKISSFRSFVQHLPELPTRSVLPNSPGPRWAYPHLQRETHDVLEGFPRSFSNLDKQRLDLSFQTLDLGVDFLEWAGWCVGVEVAGEGDFVADLGFGGVVPGVGDVGVDFGSEVVIDGGLVFEGVEPGGGVGLEGDPFGGQWETFS